MKIYKSYVSRVTIEVLMEVKLYNNQIEDNLLEFAVIIARYQSQWIFCRHKDRTTYEIPGGHREEGESIIDAAKRELIEETGAEVFGLTFLCDYSVKTNNQINYGRVFTADVVQMGKLPDSEIAEIRITEELPENWTYPEIQKKFIEYYKNK